MHSPRLQSGELLSTYIVRLAHANGLPAWRFCNLHWPDWPLWYRDVDRWSNAEVLSAISDFSGASTVDLRKASLLSVRDVLSSPTSGIIPLVLSSGVYHTTRLRHALQYCSDCLRNSPGIYQRSWRFAVSLYCPIHNIRLLDACPECGAPVMPHRSTVLRRDVCPECNGSFLDHGERRHDTSLNGVGEFSKTLTEQLLSLDNERGAHAALDRLRTVRSLIAIMSTRCQDRLIRHRLGLRPARFASKAESVFELARWEHRRYLLEGALSLLSEWPTKFREGAEVANLSQRHFARLQQPPALRQEVLRLPLRHRKRRRPPVPQIHTPELRKLMREDRHLYRRKRAKRLSEGMKT